MNTKTGIHVHLNDYLKRQSWIALQPIREQLQRISGYKPNIPARCLSGLIVTVKERTLVQRSEQQLGTGTFILKSKGPNSATRSGRKSLSTIENFAASN